MTSINMIKCELVKLCDGVTITLKNLSKFLFHIDERERDYYAHFSPNHLSPLVLSFHA